jgi:hypothetical protein
METIDPAGTEWDAIVAMTRSDGEDLYFCGDDLSNVEKRAAIYKEIDSRLESNYKIFPDAVPIEIACMGQAAIASYLFSIHGEDCEHLSNLMGVSESTIRQYISDFRHNRR